jgi:hypothetical protein
MARGFEQLGAAGWIGRDFRLVAAMGSHDCMIW